MKAEKAPKKMKFGPYSTVQKLDVRDRPGSRSSMNDTKLQNTILFIKAGKHSS